LAVSPGGGGKNDLGLPGWVGARYGAMAALFRGGLTAVCQLVGFRPETKILRSLTFRAGRGGGMGAWGGLSDGLASVGGGGHG